MNCRLLLWRIGMSCGVLILIIFAYAWVKAGMPLEAKNAPTVEGRGYLLGLGIGIAVFLNYLFKHATEKMNLRSEPSPPANPTPPGTSAAQQSRVPGSGGG